MDVILGIDTAWTDHNPSGVAVVTSKGQDWICAGVAPSYDAFIDLSEGIPVDWKTQGFKGTKVDVGRLLLAAELLAGAPVSIVTIDMPVARNTIDGRRASDKAVSEIFGARGCATHSPNYTRPGKLGADLSTAFQKHGYSIATKSCAAGTRLRLVEVYPHPALVVLMKTTYRIPYKVAKTRNYWPGTTVVERIDLLLAEFRSIHTALSAKILDIGNVIPDRGSVHSLSTLKRHEDALDALICAWAGIQYLTGDIDAYGDETAAIWIPR